MAGLIPLNRRNANLTRTGFEDFYSMMDDFFSDGLMSNRNLLRDTFKIDIEERDDLYLIEAEIPGIRKDEIDINIEDENLCITVNRAEEVNKDEKNYIHRERCMSSTSRRIRLKGAKLDEITAKLGDGILAVTVPKQIISNSSRKIEIL